MSTEDAPTRFDTIARLATACAATAAAGNERRGIVLAGEAAWGREAAAAALSGAGLHPALWVGADGGNPGECLASDRIGRGLGREWDAVVVDAHAGFDPDAFGAAVGTLRGGGLLLLLTPPLEAWPAFADPQTARLTSAPHGAGAFGGRFIARLVRVIRGSPALTVVVQGGPVPPAPAIEPFRARSTAASPSLPEPPDCRTADQARAVEAVVRVATGHRRRPVVLVADRGRGKSAALGIAAARLLRHGLTHIVVTGPRLAAVEPALDQARRRLPKATGNRGHIRIGEAVIEFVPPDALVLAPRPANLVLVDEAAALPVAMLARLLRTHARIAFATTVHGYEGSGRGFATRFRAILERETPGWREVVLHTPIRWAANDPIEAFLFRALLLDAEPAPDAAVQAATPERCRFERLDRTALAEDETLLGQLFGLLVLAHYRTSPTDLRQLLDGPDMAVLVARLDDQVVGAAVLASEGGLDAATARAVWLGHRRLRGHLLPQSLAQHLGIEQAPCLRGERIVRLAVHPAVQRRGICARLLEEARRIARQRDAAYLGVSFSASPELVRFWRRAGYRPVRIGITRETTSAAHALMMLLPLTPAGEALLAQARERLLAHLPHMLAEPLRDLEPELALAVLRGDEGPARPALDGAAWQDLLAFAFGHRAYEVCIAPLWTLTLAALSDPGVVERLEPPVRTLLMTKVLQRRGWPEAARAAGHTGRAEALAALRAAARRLIGHYGDGGIRAQVAGLSGRAWS